MNLRLKKTLSSFKKPFNLMGWLRTLFPSEFEFCFSLRMKIIMSIKTRDKSQVNSPLI